MSAELLTIEGLRIAYGADRDQVEVVHGVDLSVRQGELLALVGESGSGKSTIALALAGLLPAGGRVLGGTIRLDGAEVPARAGRRTGGGGIAVIPQDPLSSLDPLRRVGRHVARAVQLRRGGSLRAARKEALLLIARVGITEPARIYDAYPHELSGGQLQRILIAGAVAATPTLLIADEPTSALDVTVQQTILDLIQELREETGMSVLFITHDLALAKDRSTTVAVMDRGRIVEQGPTLEVLDAPAHEYTRSLLADAPALSPGRFTALRSRSRELRAASSAPALRLQQVSKHYGATADAPALARVDLEVARGDVHALVGESGSGKSTVARILAGLTGFDHGEVEVSGEALSAHPTAVNAHARRLQLVFQNPLAAADPRYSVQSVIAEPLRVHRHGDRRDHEARVREVLEQVSLPTSVLPRRLRELSGGQRQRVALARALVLAPEILVLDEPTSALDVSVQARLIELLLGVQHELGLTYLFISHDLGLVRQIADRVSVLAGGSLVEDGPAEQVFSSPRSPHTRRLLDAVPGRGAAAAVLETAGASR